MIKERVSKLILATLAINFDAEQKMSTGLI